MHIVRGLYHPHHKSKRNLHHSEAPCISEYLALGQQQCWCGTDATYHMCGLHDRFMDYDDVFGVHRPNHGIANAVRKALLVPYVANLHVKHYNGTAVKGYSFDKQDFALDPQLVFTMQVAMLFEVCGRESDIGFSDDSEVWESMCIMV